MTRSDSLAALQLQEQLAQIRAECKRLEVARAVQEDASMHAQKLDEEAVKLHGELEHVNAEIAKIEQRSSPSPRGPKDSREALRNITMLRKRNAALERTLEKCMDPSSRMREDEELKRLQTEVAKAQKEMELRTIELRQLDRTANTVGRARIEAEKRIREAQEGEADADARHLAQLTDVNLHHKEKCQAALERVKAIEHEWNSWLQPLRVATEVLKTRNDAPDNLRKLCNEPSPALSLVEVLNRMAVQRKEAKHSADQALVMEQHTLAKLQRLHYKLVHADDEALRNATSPPGSPSVEGGSPSRSSRRRRSFSDAKATEIELDELAKLTLGGSDSEGFGDTLHSPKTRDASGRNNSLPPGAR